MLVDGSLSMMYPAAGKKIEFVPFDIFIPLLLQFHVNFV